LALRPIISQQFYWPNVCLPTDGFAKSVFRFALNFSCVRADEHSDCSDAGRKSALHSSRFAPSTPVKKFAPVTLPPAG
jgi:hypothetical protein